MKCESRTTRPSISTQIVRLIRHELMLLGDDRMRVGQLLEIADQLLERAAFDDDLLMLRATGAAGEVAALISRELENAPADPPGQQPREDPTTSFESAQPPSIGKSDLSAVFNRRSPATGPHCVDDVQRLSGGFSKETVRARVSDATGISTDVVVRKVMPGRRADGLRPEYDIVSFLAASAVPVPRPLWFDESALGGPAFATTAVPGRTIGNVWGWTEPPSLDVIRDLGRAMGVLHALDPSGLGNAPLPPLQSHRDHLAAIDERADVLAGLWDDDDPYRPVFQRVLDWLRVNAPADCTEQVLVHGDFALHNVLVADNRLTGLLDWERSHLGNPSEDLAYLKPSIDQAGAWDDFVEAYRRAGGPPVIVGDLAYFTVWQDLWRAVSSYRIRAKFLSTPTHLSDAISGLLMSPRFLTRAAHGMTTVQKTCENVP